jgi:hydroxyacylglutathione hydrolase
MTEDIRVIPVSCAFQGFHTLAYYIDAPEPAIIDTGVATSPAQFIAPSLSESGVRLEDVRWVFLTHGHLDHIGGAGAIRSATGGAAQIAIHEKDAPLVRSHDAVVAATSNIMDRYVGGKGMDHFRAGLPNIISAELEPDVLLQGGERIDLGDGIVLRVVHTPGHSPGSTTYVLEGLNWAFTGDAVQLSGGVHTQFPSYESAREYRASLTTLLELDVARIHMGHPYRHPVTGEVMGPELADVEAALCASLELEEKISLAVDRRCSEGQAAQSSRNQLGDVPSPYHPFEAIAEELKYDKDPTRFPAPFFITLHGYAEERSVG